MKDIVVVLLLLAAFSCSHQQNEKDGSKDAVVRKTTYEKFIIKKNEKTIHYKLKTKERIATEILTTSPRYQQLTKGLYKAVLKNGGLSYGISLERSPYPKADKTWNYSETYDFTLYEMYDERQFNTARFSFDPNNKQLYEHDEVQEKLIPIEFDRELLLEFNALSN